VNATCDREEDVLEAVMSGQWPPLPGNNVALRGHVDGCPSCRDLVTVAAALRDEHDLAFRDAHLPTSGQVWWRASMRTRAEAAATAARPILVLQGLAGACAAGLSAALVTLAWPSILLPLASIVDIMSREAQRLGLAAVSTAEIQQAFLSVAVVVAAGLILTPLVLYLVLSDD
jgi:predicted anti-sigma-YlaC factor YlaD